MDGLKSLCSSGKLRIPEAARSVASPDDWQAFLNRLYGMNWRVYIKQTFNWNGMP